jgi:predicted GH43/DUF377 family glycosyl hydrolase
MIKNILIALLILFSVSGFGQGILGVLKPETMPLSFSQLETRTFERHEDNPIITYQAATWKARLVHFPFIIEDPFDDTKLIMFFGGGSVQLGAVYNIGRATATKADPYTWTEYVSNPIFEPSDFAGIGTIVGVDDAWWNEAEQRFELICCTYNSGQTSSWLGKYYSDDGFTFTYEGPLISPTGDETFLGNGGILREGGTWYLAYTYRTTEVLPGVRLASSTNNGATWTKHGNAITLGSAGSYDDLYMEGVQFLKIGSDYVLNYGCAKAGATITFSGAFAHSTSPLSGYVKSSINPFFQKSSSGWDETQVSTVVIFTLVEPWIFLYQGTDTPGDYTQALWSMGIGTITQ